MRFRWLFLLCCVSSVWAQNTGRLSGKVEDPGGASVPSASVELRLPESSAAVYSTATSEEGYFSFTGVQPGLYELTVTATGFQRHLTHQIKIDPARELAIPAIRLEIGSVVETVDVTASPAVVQTANAEVSTTVTAEQLRNIPTLDRQMITLVRTQAGVTNMRGPTVINGLRTSTAAVTIDGVDIQDNFLRSNSLDFLPNRPTIDQVAEFTITTSNANATVGGGVAQVSMVTPSGGNAYHGNLLWNNRNSAFSANTWFNNRSGIANPFLNQNQFGGYIGGPILKDKLLFYGGYERLDLRQQTAVNRRILTQDARSGIFTYRVGSDVRKVNVLERLGVQADPTMAAILNQMPDPGAINNFDTGDSQPGLLRNSAGYSFLMRNNRTRDNLTAKVDLLASTKHVISGTYLWNKEFVDRQDVQNDSTANTNGFGAVPLLFTDASRNLMSLTWRWNPAPRFTNELRGGFNLAPSTFHLSADAAPVRYQFTTISNPATNSLPQGRNTNTFHYMDNATYLTGRHTLQFGFNMQQIRIRKYDEANTTPAYRIGVGLNTGLTGSDLAGASATDIAAANNLLATLAGYIDQVSQRFNVTSRDSGYVPGAAEVRNLRFSTFAFYLQDNWKVRPRLSLTLGLRWEPYQAVDERDSLYLMPRLVNNNALETLRSNATLDFAGKSAGRPWYGTDWNNLAPNVGLAWDVFGDGKMSLRAGYMVAFVNDNTIATLENNASTNDGLAQTVLQSGLAARASNPPVLSAPPFRIPARFSDNYALDRTAAFGLPDPNLVTPYIQQWTAGIQREIKGTVVELRYVGNKGTKLYRGIDFNQINVFANGFFDDFMRAYNNGNLARRTTGTFNPAYNPDIPGSQPLTVISQLPNGGNLTNATYRGWIERGEPGGYFNALQNDGRNGDFSFYANPFALGTNMVQNFSNSSYHSVQIEATRRMRAGLQLQGSYVYGKVLSDSGVESDSQFEALLDINSPTIERARAVFDLTHAFKANGVWEIPMGPGHKFNPRGLRHLVEGWLIGGNLTWQSGAPFSVFSRRATVNRNGRSNVNTADTNLNKSQLDELFQLRMTGNGPYFVPSSAINPENGRAVAADGQAPFAGQAFFHPGPGTLGGLQRRMFSSPWVANLDASVIKQFRLTEVHSLDLRMEAFNVTNTPTWFLGDQLLDSSQFGRITQSFYDRRVLQFGLNFRF